MRTMLFGIGVLSFVGTALAAAGMSPGHVLSPGEIALVRGAQLSDFQCKTDIATCDEYNFADECETQGIPEGGLCRNCTNETDMHDNCVQKSGYSCFQYTAVKDCGDEVVGQCSGGACTGNLMNREVSCALDLNDCS